MKKIGIVITLFVFLLMSSPRLFAQQLIRPAKLTVKWVITPLGDAHIQASSQLDAKSWDNYKRMLGNNPDILKRQMERSFSQYFLENFKYKEDAMARKWTLSFDSLGLSRINSSGLWQVDLAVKNPDITKISDHNYILTANYTSQGRLLQEIDYVTFPKAASDIKVEKNAFGRAQFVYSLSPGGNSSGWLDPSIGVLLIAAGLFMLFRSGRTKAAS